MHGQRIAAVLVAVLMVTSMVAVSGSVTAQTEEPDAAEPASYYGTVQIDGADAPPGTVIEAVAHAPGADPTAGDGDVRDSITVREDAIGEFGGSDLFDEKLVVERTEGGPDDLQVSFLVDGQLARTIDWRAGDVRELDLAATYDPTPVFDVSIDEVAPESGDAIIAGQAFTVTATVENIGTAGDEAAVDLLVDGDETDETTTGTLDPNANETVEFTVETDEGDAPGTEITVATADRTDSRTVVIERPEPPAFDLTDFQVTDGEGPVDEAAQGDEVTLNATVENVGERNGSVTVEFALGDDGVTVVDESAEVSVDASADEEANSETVSVDATIENAPRAGEHTLDASASIPEDTAAGEATATRETTLDVDYESIQSGIDAAAESSDDTVAVASPESGDTFTENVDIDAGVTIEAVDEGVSVEPDSGSEPVFTLQSDATVSGLTVSDSSDEANTAIEIAGDGAAVEGVTVDGFATGVDVSGSNAAVRRSAFSKQSTSVDVGSAATGTAVEYNEFTVDGADTVVDIDATGVQVVANVLEPGSGTAGVGIALNEGARANIRENTILTRTDEDSDTNTAGIELDTSANFGSSLAVRNNFDGSETEFTGDNGVDIRVVGDQSNVGEEAFNATRNWAGGGQPTAASENAQQQMQAAVFASGAAQIAPMQVVTQNVDTVDTSNQLDDPVEPASFSVDIDSPEASFEAVAGEALTVDATVTNDGEASGEQTIALEDGEGTSLDETTLQLDGGTRNGVSLSYTPEAATDGLTLNVSSEDDDAEVSGDVIAPAEFAVGSLSAPDQIQSGDTVDVNATVRNDGEATGSDTVELRFGDDITGTEGDDYTVLETSKVTDLGGGADTAVEFADVSVDEDGVSEIGVASTDEVVRQPIVVEPEAAFFDVSIDAAASNETVTAGETATVEAVVENVGGQEASQFVEVLVDGVVDDDTSDVQTIAAGGEQTVSVTVDTATGDSGTINIAFETEDDDATRSVTIEPPDEEGENETDDRTDGGTDEDPVTSGGGGGGGGGGGVSFGDGPADSLELDAVETETVTPSADFGANQRVAAFDSVSNVESIAFDSTDRIGEVTVADIDPDSADVNPPGAAVTVQEISVPDDATDRSATIEFGIPADRLDAIGVEPGELTAVRLNEGQWETLDTAVAEETAEGVTLEAETPGFSVFAVNAVSEPDAAATVDPGTVTAGEEVTLDGSGSTDEYGEIVAYDWSVAGQSLAGETAPATIEETGEYTAELTVTNDAGETDTATADLVVEPAAGGDDTAGGDGTDGGEPTDEPAGLGTTAIALLVALAVLAAAAVVWVRRNG